MQARIRQGYIFAAVAAILVMVFAGTALSQSNTEVGVWKLNPAKSKYTQGAAPKSTTVTIETAGAGVKVAVDQVDAAGTAIHYTYTANYDGKDSAIVGNNPNGDTIARTRIDAMTTKSVTKKGGKVTTSLTTVISFDGKTRTNTTTGTDGMGMAVSSVAVYDRQ